MADFLVFDGDTDRGTFYEKGDIVTVAEDNHTWGALSFTNCRLVQKPEISFKEAQALCVPLYESDIARDRGDEPIKKRAVKIDDADTVIEKVRR